MFYKFSINLIFLILLQDLSSMVQMHSFKMDMNKYYKIVKNTKMKEPTTMTPRQTKSLQQGQKKIQKYIFSLNSVIGKGSYATVYLGHRITDNISTAVKVIDKKIFSNNYNVKSIQSQIDIMKKMDHNNIVKLLDVYQTNNNMYIVTQFCKDGDLRNYIKKKYKLGEIQAIKILKDLLNGFKYLYQNQIIHRDLKPANILINDGVYKISDFGFAKNLEFGQNTIMRSIVGTPLYMSPQILSKQSYTNKSDLWSIGLIFYEMIYGHTPWPANNQIQLLNNIKCRHIPFDANISEASKDFIKKCLKIKQQERMSWEQAFKHPVLNTNMQQIKTHRLSPILTPRENKENNYYTQNSRSKSKNKSPCVNKTQRSRTPIKIGDNSHRNLASTKLQTPKNCKNGSDRQYSPWRN